MNGTRSLRYTSRPAADAGAWQRQLRSALAQALHLDDLVSLGAGIPLEEEPAVLET